MKVLVSDPLSEVGVKIFQEASDIEVDVKTGLAPEELKETIGELPEKALKQFEADLNGEIEKGNVRQMTIYELFMTIVSLNIIGFLAEPIFKTITGITDVEYQKLMKKRKKENVEIILKGIKP